MTDDGWVVTPKEAPAELREGFVAEPFVATEVASEQPELSAPSLRNDTDEWFAVMHRLSDKDRAALSTVVGIANAILDNNAE